MRPKDAGAAAVAGTQFEGDLVTSAPLPQRHVSWSASPEAAAEVRGEITRAYEMTAVAARRARSDTRMLLTGLGWNGDVDDATLAASELVTNAYRHANRDGRKVRMRLAVMTDGDLLIEVSDSLPGFAPRTPGPECGRGLPILVGLATDVDWYLHGDASGKTVRARFAA